MPEHEPEALREQPGSYAAPPETQRIIDELYREELREARAMPPEQKLLLGEELFENHAGRNPKSVPTGNGGGAKTHFGAPAGITAKN
jgi:hypothetical protein